MVLIDKPEESHSSVTPECSSIDEFLLAAGRKRLSVQGDGNCMFRSLASQLLGSEDHHLAVRTLITRFENLNKERFEGFLIASVNAPTMQEHIRKLMRLGTWGTHVELIAIATYLQIPVYYCRENPSARGFKWERLKALGLAIGFRYPCVVEDDPMHPMHRQQITHFELLYYVQGHYDSIVSTESNKVATDLPFLPLVPIIHVSI